MGRTLRNARHSTTIIALAAAALLLGPACGARSKSGAWRDDGGGIVPNPPPLDNGPRIYLDVYIDVFPDAAPLRDVSVDRGLMGACLSPQDFSRLDTDAKREDAENRAGSCGLGCLGNPDQFCARDCVRKELGLSIACASCFAEAISCAVARCLAQCAADPQAFGCRECRRINCDPQFGVCSGLGI
ncbi:MAG: hypothetical protein KC503_08370 [Myxococcales bacterium]|nr:hypothetical protein [Myxococcales bacterium]